MRRYLRYTINEHLHVKIGDTRNGAILFGVVNVLLSFAKERKINGCDDLIAKTKNGKIKVHCFLYKR